MFLGPYALPLTPLVLLMLMMFLGSPSLTLKYGAAALISLNGAVLCKAMMVSHCLSVIWPTLLATIHSRTCIGSWNRAHTLCITPSHVKPALLTMMWIFPPPNSAAFFTSSSMYCAFSMSPGTAIAFPLALLIIFATASAFAV